MNTENKNTENKTTEYGIPVELFADILRIILKGKILYQIRGVKSQTNVILLTVKYGQDKLHGKARENIESLLEDFSHYMEGLSDNVILSEESE